LPIWKIPPKKNLMNLPACALFTEKSMMSFSPWRAGRYRYFTGIQTISSVDDAAPECESAAGNWPKSALPAILPASPVCHRPSSCPSSMKTGFSWHDHHIFPKVCRSALAPPWLKVALPAVWNASTLLALIVSFPNVCKSLCLTSS